MSDRPTPETDAEHAKFAIGGFTLDFCRKLERERDEARKALSDWENASAHVEADHPDEVHCGCVPVLRKLLTDAIRERDEAIRLLKLCADYTITTYQEKAEEFLKKIK